MCRRLFYLFVINCLTITSVSQDADNDRISCIASAFVQGYLGEERLRISEIKDLNIGDSKYLCVVNLSPGGWLLMSRNYSVMPVIAFSLTGTFVIPNPEVNENQFLFLSGYEQQIRNAMAEKSSFTDPRWDPFFYQTKSSGVAAEVTVSPLIKVTWNQGSGWNRFCPEDAEGPGGHVYAGCVAVSMAQAMSVYGVPATGYGSKQYVHPEYGLIFADFGSATYDWANMSPTVSDENNALLLYHCAVSVGMDFAPDGSGTLTSAAASTALKSFFRYSQEISWARRGTDTNLWKKRLDENLLAGRPVIYAGFPVTGSVGHAFNIDGVFRSDYYHINWGWSGVNDGYYTIDNLKPGSSNFTRDHSAIFGIQPFYYPTDVALSDTLVLLNLPAGKAIGKFKVVDEATDNSYEVSLVCDSTLNGTEWVPDYYLDGDTLRAAREFERADGPADTVTFIVDDAHGNSIRATRLLLLTASLSAGDEVDDELFTLYPVPFSDQLVITLPPSGIKVTVRNLTGRIVSEMLTSGSRVTYPAAGLPPGIYIVTVTTNRGDQFSRIVVKK